MKQGELTSWQQRLQRPSWQRQQRRRQPERPGQQQRPERQQQRQQPGRPEQQQEPQPEREQQREPVPEQEPVLPSCHRRRGRQQRSGSPKRAISSFQVSLLDRENSVASDHPYERL